MLTILKRRALEKQARAEVKSMTLVPADGLDQHGLTSRLPIGRVKLKAVMLAVMMLGVAPADAYVAAIPGDKEVCLSVVYTQSRTTVNWCTGIGPVNVVTSSGETPGNVYVSIGKDVFFEIRDKAGNKMDPAWDFGPHYGPLKKAYLGLGPNRSYKVGLTPRPTCTLDSSWTTAKRDIALGNISVPSGTPVGEPFQTVTVTMPGAGNIVTGCPATTYPWKRTTKGSLVTGYTDVYSTNLDGVGYRITPTNSNDGSAFTSTHQGSGFSGDSSWYDGDIKFELIKTGTITTGKLDTGRYGYITFHGTNAVDDVLAASFEVTTGTISTPTCSMSAPATIHLGNVAASRFGDIGNTSDKVAAKLSFTGCDNSLGSITLKASGTADSVNKDLFALSSASTAKGIGIELLDANSTTIKPDSSTDWTTTQSNAQYYGYTFQVRYQQTHSTVTPGIANGAITINANYK